MAKINHVCVGESLVGEGNEVAHIDLLIGPRGSAVETAFCNALTNNKDGFTSLLAVVAPNLITKPNTVMFNKVTIKGAKQAVQMFGPSQRAVAMALRTASPKASFRWPSDDLFICVVCSFTGRRPTTRRSRTTTTRPPRNQSRVRSTRAEGQDYRQKGSWTIPSRPTSIFSGNQIGPLRALGAGFSFRLPAWLVCVTLLNRSHKLRSFGGPRRPS